MHWSDLYTNCVGTTSVGRYLINYLIIFPFEFSFQREKLFLLRL